MNYVQNAEIISRSPRATSDLECYNYYLPLIAQVPNGVNTSVGECTTYLNEETAAAHNILVYGKEIADYNSADTQVDVIACNTIEDHKKSLQCHSKQVSS